MNSCAMAEKFGGDCKDLLIQQLTQRAEQAEEVVAKFPMPIPELTELFEKHIQTNTSQRLYHLEGLLQGSIDVLEALRVDLTACSDPLSIGFSETVNKLVSALKGAVLTKEQHE